MIKNDLIINRNLNRRRHRGERSEDAICLNAFKTLTDSFGVLFTNYGFKKYFTQRSQRRRNGRNVGVRGDRGVFLWWRSWREIFKKRYKLLIVGFSRLRLDRYEVSIFANDKHQITNTKRAQSTTRLEFASLEFGAFPNDY